MMAYGVLDNKTEWFKGQEQLGCTLLLWTMFYEWRWGGRALSALAEPAISADPVLGEPLLRGGVYPAGG